MKKIIRLVFLVGILAIGGAVTAKAREHYNYAATLTREDSKAIASSISEETQIGVYLKEADSKTMFALESSTEKTKFFYNPVNATMTFKVLAGDVFTVYAKSMEYHSLNRISGTLIS